MGNAKCQIDKSTSMLIILDKLLIKWCFGERVMPVLVCKWCS